MERCSGRKGHRIRPHNREKPSSSLQRSTRAPNNRCSGAPRIGLNQTPSWGGSVPGINENGPHDVWIPDTPSADKALVLESVAGYATSLSSGIYSALDSHETSR